MKITKHTYYHFQRINATNIRWQVGDKIVFNSSRQNFYYTSLKNGCNEILHENKIPYDVIKGMEEDIFNEVHIEKSQKQLDKMLDLIKIEKDKNKIIQYFQEVIYEQVRKKNYSQLPSRNNCIWVVPKLEDLDEWQIILSSIRNKKLKLSLTGEIHKTSGLLICTDKNRQIKNALENANLYWNPNFKLKEETEFLFEGQIEINEVFIS